MVLIAGVVLVGLFRAVQANSAPAITLHEAGPLSSITPTPSASVPVQAHGSTPTPPNSPDAPTDAHEADAPEIVVHVVGAVRHPGVYRLGPGARNEDALKAAGGPTAAANSAAVNLAAHVEDGTQLYIPTHREHPEDHADATTAAATGAPAIPQPASSIPTVASGGNKGAKGAHSGSKHSGKADKLTTPGQGINLNTATAEELQRIPGIGPAMAERLIAYRQQNGAFHSVEDLLQVSGIGEKKFARIQPYVRVR
jgi:competence protein ComEA